MQLRELLAQYAPCRQQGICYFGKFLVAFDEFANALLELSGSDRTDLEAEVAQQATHVVLERDGLFLQQLSRRQKRPMLLTGQGLDVDLPEQVDAHHLRYAACIIPISLINLRFQKSLGMPGLDANHRQAGIRESAVQPLRQRASFKPNSHEAIARISEDLQEILGVRCNLALELDTTCLVDDADRCFLD
jgi:hypothetical protein